MRRMVLLLLLAGATLGSAEISAQPAAGGGGGGQANLPTTGGQATWAPTRINKVIELLESGQTVYYQQVEGGGYDDGVRLAQTSADYISYNLEHSYMNVQELREFMRGLVAGGPTKSGHRTPAVIVVLPAIGWTEEAMRGNTWMLQHIMAAGVHGMLLTHAVDPVAARIMVEAIRYPFAPVAVGLSQGMQGSGSAGFAAGIWGIPQNQYLQKADPWPLNPNGEVILGLKIENIHAVQNAEQLVRTPGIGFAEWGPGDQGYWMGHMMGLGAPAPANTPELATIRTRVLQATKDAGIFFLNACGNSDVRAMIDEGVRICTGGQQVGRPYSNRQMPW